MVHLLSVRVAEVVLIPVSASLYAAVILKLPIGISDPDHGAKLEMSGAFGSIVNDTLSSSPTCAPDPIRKARNLKLLEVDNVLNL